MARKGSSLAVAAAMAAVTTAALGIMPVGPGTTAAASPPRPTLLAAPPSPTLLAAPPRPTLLAAPPRPTSAEAPAKPSATSCQHPHGPFSIRTVDGRPQVVAGNGRVFVATGITVYGLSMFGVHEPSQPHAWNQDGQVSSDIAQINAMATSWCANTVRIQGAPDALFSGKDGAVNQKWVAALEQEVNAAVKDNLNVVITAQTENEYRNGTYVGQPMPTQQTADYWRYLGTTVFKKRNNIFFDIFNEPRVASWNEWFDGDPSKGYIGMNQLVSDIRHDGIGRLLWIEGANAANSLAQSVNYTFTDPGNLVYDIHHPYGVAHHPNKAPHDVQQWYRDFGKVAATHPVVIGEWTQYESNASECWTDAPARVPQFLAYVKKLGLGLIAWTLNRPGVLVTGGLSSAATTMTRGSYACRLAPNGRLLGQGAGQQLKDWFYTVNGTS